MSNILLNLNLAKFLHEKFCKPKGTLEQLCIFIVSAKDRIYNQNNNCVYSVFDINIDLYVINNKNKPFSNKKFF